ncbi:BBE domain-containing protein [Streptomyces sp. ISL-11]|uniref:BBE domain-containing protein n=1 Tax=Streptomyces sp. ISL-11 TaxID=2819174 RepID=UPI001BEB385D|nr:BBE domain-containing protein [Streptomyces sp. ISL-11]MBT2384657.1 BBE domain-containing protein [Streptomyces sp. ISL-11]
MIDAVVEHSPRITSPRSYSLIPHLGGAISRVPEDATASSHRHATCDININGVFLPDDPDPGRHIAWVRELFDALAPYADGVYVHFLGAEGPDRVRAAYGAAKYERLAALKTTWDPGNFFHRNQNVPRAWCPNSRPQIPSERGCMVDGTA